MSLHALPSHAKLVPPDSFFVLSLKTEKIIEQSSIKKSLTWAPILHDWGNRNPSMLEFLIDMNASGVNFDRPIHFFSRLQGTKNPDPVIGVLATVQDKEMVDSSLHAIAETLKIKKKPSPFTRFGNEFLPYEFGRRGSFVYFIAVIKRSPESTVIPNDVYLDEIIQTLPKKSDEKKLPASLSKHLANLKDCSVYLDGSGIVRLAEAFWPSNQWETALPLIETIINRSIGVYIQSNPGNLRVDLRSLTDHNISLGSNVLPPSSSLDLIPGDSPLIAKLNIEPKHLKEMGTTWLDQTLKTFSGGQIDLNFKLPGFNLSTQQILNAPNGNFVLGLGGFDPLVFPPSERNPNGEVQLNPYLLSAMGINNSQMLRKLAIGLESSNTIGSLLRQRGFEVIERNNDLWFTSPEYSRELNFNKTLRPIDEARNEFLNSHAIAADIRVLPLTKSIRRNRNLPYDYFKLLDWIEKISNIKLFSGDRSLSINFRLFDKKINALKPIFDFIGQEIIDRRNASLYRAIAQNDYQSLQQSIKSGALVNANDYFGHTPLHYASYKGNEGVVDFILRNGGNPNVKSKHLSTPLHSAAWGRNLKVAELLLEDGADVNAQTDEGETPAMTAALRGEKDLLETLFSLSADPHAKDIHGSNLYDLASAGGHLEILDLLDELKVKNNHPFHAAAGKGDLKVIKKMLKNGRKVNEKDAFGATPLIIATVSGKMEVVRFLLQKNANPKITAKDGYTMMHAAAFSGKKELVQLAYDLGLDVNARYGKDGVTPVDVGEDESDAMPILQSLGGRRGWELGRTQLK